MLLSFILFQRWSIRKTFIKSIPNDIIIFIRFPYPSLRIKMNLFLDLDLSRSLSLTHTYKNICNINFFVNKSDMVIHFWEGTDINQWNYLIALWATRQTEETKGNRELHVKTTLRELIIYLVFLIILCVGKGKPWQLHVSKVQIYSPVNHLMFCYAWMKSKTKKCTTITKYIFTVIFV